MKKVTLLLSTIAILFFSTNTKAQDASMMIGLNGGLFLPACTNCGSAVGGGANFSYSVMENIAAHASFDYYSNSPETFTMFQVAGHYYFNESLRGFYGGIKLGLVGYSFKFLGTKFSQTDFTIGAEIGAAIPLGESIAIVPHIGYGTWVSGSNGVITTGLKVGYKF